MTDFTGRFTRVLDELRRTLEGACVVEDPERRGGRGYYAGLCFKVYGSRDGRRYELSDGGVVDWTQQLLQNRKERLTISGIGVERLLAL
ncbi:hypothetical protein [Phytoactinopolyspora halotolerans]|uniref:Uncharacterized protein n=1 Tax=Phytoactinopolyspora halotolerans TaxID=1981512 RepID=A0A6L9SGM2_9ACTN|nr:hypothetical protein [Phytoactinopolyspora halotolerans]NEE04299.1 hypothetical protein [Phytoactinopolyspora halotolerans]